MIHHAHAGFELPAYDGLPYFLLLSAHELFQIINNKIAHKIIIISILSLSLAAATCPNAGNLSPVARDDPAEVTDGR